MPVEYAGSLETLQNAATATGVGTTIDMKGRDYLTLHVSGTFSATVSFEGTIDDTNYFALGLLNVSTGAIATTATGAGAFKMPSDGPALSQFRANITAYTSGSITVRSRKEYR